MAKRIGIAGDFHNSVTQTTIAHAIEHANRLLGFDTTFTWIDSEKLESDDYTDWLIGFDGIWSPPGSPFKSLNGAINAIRFTREHNIPFIGTCAGFQHAIIEYARNVSGFTNAAHAEYSDTGSLFINKMACSLKGTKDKVFLVKGSLAQKCYETEIIEGNYFCSYGLNNEFLDVFKQSEFVISGYDSANSIRILELKNHPFFVLTVFVPQVDSSIEHPNKLITEFVRIVNV